MKKKLLFGLTALMTLGLVSCASDGKTPYIGENGNWWIDSSDLGVPAQGEPGKDGSDGQPGQPGKDGSNGQPGEPGASVTVVSVEKTGTEGPIDTYTITFSDGTTAAFTVTNGETITVTSIEKTDSTGLVDTYTITFSNGATYAFSVTNGKDGRDLAITSIEHTGTEGLIDTYTITYSDGSTFNFAVSNGADGLTPYIGENGNWWIGDEDTGVLADWEKANNVPLTDLSNGLTYTTMTIGNKTGFVVTGWDDDYFEDYLGELPKSNHLVIPNYIGSVPVIGVKQLWMDELVHKITLSKNTVFLWDSVFAGNDCLEEIDFNGCSITAIPNNAFTGTRVMYPFNLPSSVTKIGNGAFSGVPVQRFDFSNIKYIGSNAFDNMPANYVYLPKTVEYVGSNAFKISRVYIEHEEVPAGWASVITSSSESNGRVTANCKIEGDYLYSADSTSSTVYQYLGNEKKITLPSEIGGKPVTKVGYGFASLPYFHLNKHVFWETFQEANRFLTLREINLPDGIKEIDDFAFYGFGMMITAPASLEKISETVLEALAEPDDIMAMSIGLKEVFAQTNYLALESNDMPSVVDATSHTVDSGWTKSEVEAQHLKISFGTDRSKLEDDDLFYYLNDGESYSILAYKGLVTKALTVPASFNNKPVTTILSNAIGLDSSLESVVIENGISRIRPYGIRLSNGGLLTIPSSVSVINANGIVSGDGNLSIYVSVSSKPVDWDSNWTNVLGNVVFGVDGDVYSNRFFIYSVKDGKATLISYLGTSSNVAIPTEIDGNPVTTIKKGFYSNNGGAEIYLPSSVTTIEERAFVNSSSKKFVFFAAASSKPDGWNDNFYYNTYSNNNSSYVEKKWSQLADKLAYAYADEYAYYVNGDEITLLSYCGGSEQVFVPRKIGDKNVTGIKAYCYHLEAPVTVCIPKQVLTIESIAFEIYMTSGNYYTTSYFNCEPSSRPQGWSSTFAYNTYYQSTSYININYGAGLNY